MRAAISGTISSMRKNSRSLLYLAVLLTCPLLGQSHPKDVKNSADHPLFPNRMPGFYISSYDQFGFASYAFRTKPPTPIEGKHTRINYYLTAGETHPGGLAIRRNYENAMKAAGGSLVYSDAAFSVMKATTRDGKEVWAEVRAPSGSGRYYFLNIVEVESMAQVISADAMAAAIDKDGFIALDIHFATGKADILPESKPAIDEMVALLKKRTDLKVGVEGHTDNTGSPETNMTLSKARAVSVVAALTSAGIAAARLTPAGFGQTKPIADNRTEEGRAKNRRVELVKK